ncbi:hypothetical protein RB595_004535 [Gaeumannomyces hyphopodioides]
MDSFSQQNLGPRLSNDSFLPNGFSRRLSRILLREITASIAPRPNTQAFAFIVGDYLRAIGNLSPFALLRYEYEIYAPPTGLTLLTLMLRILAATSDLLASSARETMNARRTSPSAMRAELQSTASPHGRPPARQLSIQTNIAGPMGQGYCPGRGGSPSSSRRSSSSDSAWEASSSTTVFVNDILYSTKEIRTMADELDLAHHSGEFPATRFLNYNPQATVDDHRRLMELREAHESNDTARASLLLVNLTRDIRERDAELDERLEHQRALRQVDACIRSAQEEERLFRIMQTALLQHNAHSVTRSDLASIVEQNGQDLQQVEARLENMKREIYERLYGLRDELIAKNEETTAFMHTTLPILIQQSMEQTLRQSKKDRRTFAIFSSNSSRQDDKAEPKGWRRLVRKVVKKPGGLGKDKSVAAAVRPPPSPMGSVPMIFLDESSVVRTPCVMPRLQALARASPMEDIVEL